jgi:hypothetical protein
MGYTTEANREGPQMDSVASRLPDSVSTEVADSISILGLTWKWVEMGLFVIRTRFQFVDGNFRMGARIGA